MTSRRSFFRSLTTLTTATSLSPHIFIPKLQPIHWKPILFKRNPPLFKPADFYGDWKFMLDSTLSTIQTQGHAIAFKNMPSSVPEIHDYTDISQPIEYKIVNGTLLVKDEPIPTYSISRFQIHLPSPIVI